MTAKYILDQVRRHLDIAHFQGCCEEVEKERIRQIELIKALF